MGGSPVRVVRNRNMHLKPADDVVLVKDGRTYALLCKCLLTEPALGVVEYLGMSRRDIQYPAEYKLSRTQRVAEVTCEDSVGVRMTTREYCRVGFNRDNVGKFVQYQDLAHAQKIG